MDSIMVFAAILLLAIVLGFTGVCMIYSPRRFAVVCEVFAAAGGLPSLLPRSVKSALLQVRTFGVCLLVSGTILTAEAFYLMGVPSQLRAAEIGGKLYWLIFPAMLGISAGYVILAYGSEWVGAIFGKWVDHPMVPRELVYTITWEMRLAGTAFTLFGLGAASIWLKSMLG
ncbi:MAG TPA: hypothetical protein VGS20_17050 [Candidatus Acidoferrales bacterium]|nr:hypothetical protein [Candidatus Acidoferrales bacterium]